MVKYGNFISNCCINKYETLDKSTWFARQILLKLHCGDSVLSLFDGGGDFSGVNLRYNVVLVSGVQQREYIYPRGGGGLDFFPPT